MKKIGFIRLDIIEKPISKNLIKADYLIIIYDLNSTHIEKLLSEGPEEAISLKDIATEDKIITTMLPNSTYVRAAVINKGGIIGGAKPRMIFLSTQVIEII